MIEKPSIILVDQIEPLILDIRGQKILLDRDLAALYGVAARRLNEQVRRNIKRFPADFRFRLTMEERSEVVAKCAHLASLKFSRQLPYAFTEHGAIMAATVLNSPRAVEVSVFIVRPFVKLRQLVSAIRQLMAPPPDDRPKRRIGFGRN